jgi:hypothetical protein
LLAVVAWGVWRTIGPDLAGLSRGDLLRWQPSIGGLLLSTVLLVGVYVAHAVLWRRIMRDLEIGEPGPRDTMRVYFVASLGRYVPGKLWQIAGLALLARRAGLPAGGAAAAAVLGQFAFLTTGLLCLAILLPGWAGGAPALIAAVAVVLLAGGLWVLVETPVGHGGREWLRGRLGSRLGSRLEAAFELADRVRPFDALAWAVGYGFTWVLLGLAFSIFVSAFVPAASTHSKHLAGTIAASYLAGYVMVLAPAGLGVRETAMVGLLSQVPGMPVAGAVALPIFSRIWFTLAELLPLALVPVLPVGRRPMPRQHAEPDE